MARKFAELRAKMSPEARARVEARVRKTLKDARTSPFKGKRITFAKISDAELYAEIVEVLFDIGIFSDESHLNDFSDQFGEPVKETWQGFSFAELKQRFWDFYGVELPTDPKQQSFDKLAQRIRGTA
jgi:hypothetical protein